MIDKDNIKYIYRLSPMQEGILFHSLMERSTEDNYLIKIHMTVRGELQIDCFEKSVEYVFDKYDILKTTFIYEKLDAPVQIVMRKYAPPIQVFDEEAVIRTESNSDHAAESGFMDSLFSITIIKTAKNIFKIIFSIHHIIMDGWSLNIILNEIFKNYVNLINHQPMITGREVPFKLYIDENKPLLQKGLPQFWKSYFDDYSSDNMYFYEDLKRENKMEYWFSLDQEAVRNMKEAALTINVSLGTLIQTLWGLTFLKLADKKDMIFGMVCSCRKSEIKNIEHMVGPLINTVPFRLRYQNSDSLVKILKNAQSDMFHIADNTIYELNQISKLVSDSGKLFNQILAFENYPSDYQNINKILSQISEGKCLKIEDIAADESSNYPIAVSFFSADDLAVRIIYDSQEYNNDFFEHIQNYFQYLIDQFLHSHNVEIRDLKILSLEEEREILAISSDCFAYDQNLTIENSFRNSVMSFASKTAVICGKNTITYAELDVQSDVIAYELRQRNFKKESIVAIMIERSIETVIAIIGVMKTEYTYLPIESTIPVNRINTILEDSQAVMLITTEKDYQEISETILTPVAYETFFWETIDFNRNVPHSETEAIAVDNNLYIIYTSGTTGGPKGSIITRRNLLRLIFNDADLFLFNDNHRWSLFHSFSFDFSVWEMYNALLRGSTLVVATKSQTTDFEKLHESLIENKVDILSMTPSAFKNLMLTDSVMKEKLNLNMVFFGGETVYPILLKDFAHKYQRVSFINMYGTTETCVVSTYKVYSQEDIDRNINSIGKALPTTSIYIMDDSLHLMPVGQCGEICIGGPGVGKGYLNRPELTKERFVPNPYNETEKIYRTGDLGYYKQNGEITYIGRNDQQVKIRGYRIELEEVEKTIATYQQIFDTVVIPVKQGENENLTAFYTAKEKVSVNSLKNFLSEQLPDYMIPIYFIQLDEMPLGNSGKADKRKLKDYNIEASLNINVSEPVSEIEKNLVLIWKEVLGLKSLGILDNFFYLGGDSIKAMQVASRMRKLGFLIDIKTIFKYATIKQCAEHVTSEGMEKNKEVSRKSFGLLPMHNWFFATQTESLNYFNQAVMLQKSEINEADVLRCLKAIFLKYPELRLAVHEREKQESLPFSENIYQFESCERELTVDQDITDIVRKMHQQINFTDHKLICIKLVKAKNIDVLLFVFHHYLIDNVSWHILMEDFVDLYSQPDGFNYDEIENSGGLLIEKRVAELAQYKSSQELLTEKRYWDNVNSHVCNKYCADNTEYELANSYTFTLERDLSEAVMRKIHKTFNTSVQDILLAALGMTMPTLIQDTFSEFLPIMLEGHGRDTIYEKHDYSNAIGWFTALFPFLINISNKKDMTLYIKTIKEDIRHIPYGGIGYSLLKYSAGAKYDNIPLLSFNYLGELKDHYGDFKFTFLLEHLVGAKAHRITPVIINIYCYHDELVISLNVDKAYEKIFAGHTFFEEYTANLNQLAEYCSNRQEREMTPSDVDAGGLTMDDLSIIQKQLDGLRG